MPFLTVLVVLSGLLVVGLVIPTIAVEAVLAAHQFPTLRWVTGLVTYVVLTQLGVALADRRWLSATVIVVNAATAVNLLVMLGRASRALADRRVRA